MRRQMLIIIASSKFSVFRLLAGGGPHLLGEEEVRRGNTFSIPNLNSFPIGAKILHIVHILKYLKIFLAYVYHGVAQSKSKD